MTEPILSQVLVSVADEDDAVSTADTIEPYVESGQIDRLVVAHVIEKSGGGLDKAPLGRREEMAEECYAVFEERFGNTPLDLETRTEYHTDLVDGIRTAAADANVTSIAFVPRGGSRLVDLLAGDVRNQLIVESDVPVVALPD